MCCLYFVLVLELCACAAYSGIICIYWILTCAAPTYQACRPEHTCKISKSVRKQLFPQHHLSLYVGPTYTRAPRALGSSGPKCETNLQKSAWIARTCKSLHLWEINKTILYCPERVVLLWVVFYLASRTFWLLSESNLFSHFPSFKKVLFLSRFTIVIFIQDGFFSLVPT